MAIGNFNKVVLEISATSDKLVHEVGKANKSLSALEGAAKRLQNTLLGTFGAYQVIGAIRNAGMVLGQFDKSMVSLKVITGATDNQMNLLEKSARLLGSTTQYTAKEVADLQLEFGRLGFSASEIIKATDSVVDLSIATGEGLARSAEIAGSTMRAFNLDASEMSRVTNAIANALNSSALTLDSFADGIKYVAPVAAATNVTIEETAAMMSVLADAGIKGSQAGTSLRRIFTLLTSEGKPLQERLSDLSREGITLAGANDEVGLYAQTALLVLTRYLPRVTALTAAFHENNTAAKEMADKIGKNLATTFQKMKTAYDALILSYGRGNGVLGSAAEHWANLLTVMSMTKEEQEKLGTNWAEAMFSGLLAPLAPSVAKEYADALRKLRAEEVKSLKESELNYEKYNKWFAKMLFEKHGNRKAGGSKSASFFDINKKFGDDPKRANDIKREYLSLVQKQLDAEIKLAGLPLIQQMASDEAWKAWKEDHDKKLIELDKEAERLLDIDNIKRFKRIRDLEASQAGPPKTLGNYISDSTPEAKIEGINGMAEAVKHLTDNIDLLNKRQEITNENSMRGAALWEFWGNTVSDVLDNVIAKDQDFAKSAAETTARIIDGARKEIAVYIAKAAAKALALNPTPGGIATASAIIGIGLSLVSGVLKKFAKTSDTNVRPSSSSSYAMASDSQSSVSFRIRGEDLVGTINNYNRNGRYTYAGG